MNQLSPEYTKSIQLTSHTHNTHTDTKTRTHHNSNALLWNAFSLPRSYRPYISSLIDIITSILPMVWNAVNSSMKPNPSSNTFQNFLSMAACVSISTSCRRYLYGFANNDLYKTHEKLDNGSLLLGYFIYNVIWWIYGQPAVVWISRLESYSRPTQQHSTAYIIWYAMRLPQPSHRHSKRKSTKMRARERMMHSGPPNNK